MPQNRHNSYTRTTESFHEHSRTMGPFFAPKANPAPQPASAFVQIDLVPKTRSVTHSSAVYTPTSSTNMKTTSKYGHALRSALSLEVGISHRTFELTMSQDLQPYFRSNRLSSRGFDHSRVPHHRHRHLAKGSHKETEGSSHCSRYMISSPP